MKRWRRMRYFAFIGAGVVFSLWQIADSWASDTEALTEALKKAKQITKTEIRKKSPFAPFIDSRPETRTYWAYPEAQAVFKRARMPAANDLIGAWKIIADVGGDPYSPQVGNVDTSGARYHNFFAGSLHFKRGSKTSISIEAFHYDSSTDGITPTPCASDLGSLCFVSDDNNYKGHYSCRQVAQDSLICAYYGEQDWCRGKEEDDWGNCHKSQLKYFAFQRVRRR